MTSWRRAPERIGIAALAILFLVTLAQPGREGANTSRSQDPPIEALHATFKPVVAGATTLRELLDVNGVLDHVAPALEAEQLDLDGPYDLLESPIENRLRFSINDEIWVSVDLASGQLRQLERLDQNQTRESESRTQAEIETTISRFLQAAGLPPYDANHDLLAQNDEGTWHFRRWLKYRGVKGGATTLQLSGDTGELMSFRHHPVTIPPTFERHISKGHAKAIFRREILAHGADPLAALIVGAEPRIVKPNDKGSGQREEFDPDRSTTRLAWAVYSKLDYRLRYIDAQTGAVIGGF